MQLGKAYDPVTCICTIKNVQITHLCGINNTICDWDSLSLHIPVSRILGRELYMASLQFTEGFSIPEPYIERKLLLNHMVDGLAQTRPFGVLAERPNPAVSYGAGFRRVTYRDLSNAINGIAWWLLMLLAREPDSRLWLTLVCATSDM